MRLIDLFERMEAFHGTASEFRAFRPLKKEFHPSKVGIWFTSSRDTASHIANLAKRMIDDEPRVITAQIRLEQPKRYETYADFLADFGTVGDSGKLRRRLLRAGHDGIEITRSDTDGAGIRTDYAVFSPSQVDVVRSDPTAKR
jgi:hypothetical protein